MSKAALKSTLVSVSTLVLLGFAPAFAGDNAARAKAYFNAIADGNAEAIASFYADDAEFRWIGGPLAGVYKGKGKIRAVWEKFSEAAGKLDHDVLQLSENTAGKGPSITATVKFKGEGEVPVRFAITYKNGRIVGESWQVAKETAAYVQETTSAAAGQGEAKDEAQAEAPATPATPPAEVESTASDEPATITADAGNRGGSPETESEGTDSSYLPKPANTADAAPAAETPAPLAPAVKPAARQTTRSETKSGVAEVKAAYRPSFREICAGHGRYGSYGGYGGFRWYGRY